MKWKLLSHVWLFVTPWTLAFQCPLSMKFSGIMEWFAIPFSRRSFWPRGQIQVSCITGRFFIIWATREAGEVAQSCLTLCDPLDCSLPGFTHKIFQARMLEWVAIHTYMTSLEPQMIKNLPVMQETRVWSLSLEGPLEKGMATQSSILAWRIPWT